MAGIFTGGSLKGKIPLMTIDEYLFGVMDNRGSTICMTNVTRDKDYTCAETLLISRRLARGLQALGCSKGDTVTVYANNSEEFVFMFLAVVHAGLVINPINPAATPYEMRHYLKEIQPRVILTEEDLVSNVEAALDVVKLKPKIFLRQGNNSKYQRLLDLGADLSDSTALKPSFVDVKNDTAAILFSSGTTGLPKGVMLTHHNFVSTTYIRTNSVTGALKPTLGIFPMFHVAGLIQAMGSFYMGSRHFFMEKYNFEILLRTIQKYKIEHLLIPPPIMVQLSKSPLVNKYDLSSLVSCHSGAAPVKKETEDSFKKRFNIKSITQGYGLTETCAGVLFSKPNPDKGVGSCGRVPMGVEMKVVDPDTGRTVGLRQRGEICIRSSQVMKGYLNNPAATRATVDEDGWLHSGDIGYFDEDGYMYIVDRLKELIKYKGNQVAPAELEALLLQHPEVEDVGVVGVPDTAAGEIPRAYVVRAPGSTVTQADLQKFVKDHVSHYKQLRGGVVFVDSIPKLSSGKIRRNLLRELAKSQPESKL